VLPRGLVTALVTAGIQWKRIGHDLVPHCTQLRKCGGRRHVDGNLNVNVGFVFSPVGVSGGTVGGTGL
jgi:citrate lyase alpha subunit